MNLEHPLDPSTMVPGEQIVYAFPQENSNGEEADNNPKIQIEVFPKLITPEFLIYLGWWDVRETQAKMIREKKGLLQRWAALVGNLKRMLLEPDFPNMFYGIGVEDAMLAAAKRPTELIPPLHEYAVIIPWKVPNFNTPPNGEPGLDTCMVCHKAGSWFIYVEQGPAFNSILCSEDCLQRQLRYYVEEDRMIKLWVEGLVERPYVHLDLPYLKLKELVAQLPNRSDLRKQAQLEAEARERGDFIGMDFV